MTTNSDHYNFIIVLTRLLSWKQRPTKILPTFRERMIEGKCSEFLDLVPSIFQKIKKHFLITTARNNPLRDLQLLG